MPSGHLIYTVAHTACGVVRSEPNLETRGPSVMVVPQVAPTATGGMLAVVARDGTLAYATGIGRAGNIAAPLVWVDRQGRETLIWRRRRALPSIPACRRRDARRSEVDRSGRDIWKYGSKHDRRSRASRPIPVMTATHCGWTAGSYSVPIGSAKGIFSSRRRMPPWSND